MGDFRSDLPLGTDNPEVFYANVGNLDEAVTGRVALFWYDRKGVKRKTYFALEEDIRLKLLSLDLTEVPYVAGGTIDVQMQYVIAPDGNAYQIIPTTPLPYELTGDWATDSPNFMLMGDLALRNELSQSGGSTMIGVGDKTVSDVIKDIPVAYDSLSSANGEIGSLVQVGNIIFRVSQDQPFASFYPSLKNSNGNYLVPHKTLDEKIGALSVSGSVSGSFWNKNQGNQLQGSEFDIRANTVISTSLKVGSSPEVAKLVEISFPSGSVVGESDYLPTGHSEYFSVFYSSQSRYVAFCDGMMLSVYLADSLSSMSEALSLDLSTEFTSDVTCFSYNENQIAVRGVSNSKDVFKIFDIVDILSGNLIVKDTFFYSAFQQAFPIVPRQNFRFLCGKGIGLAGFATHPFYRSSLTVVDSTGEIESSCSLDYSGSFQNDEVESLFFVFNESEVKFDIYVGVWDIDGSGIKFLLCNDSSVPQVNFSSGSPWQLFDINPNPYGSASQFNGLSSGYRSQGPVAVTTLFVGGENRSHENNFDYGKFLFQQVVDNPTRAYAQIMYDNQAQVLFTSDKDTSVETGVRLGVVGYGASLHAFKGGTKFGNSVFKGASQPYAAVTSAPTADAPVGGFFGSHGGKPAIVLSAALDVAIPKGEALVFGEYDPVAETNVLWYAMEATNFRAVADNTVSLGRANARWSTVYAVTGSINTSDIRFKTQIRDISETERLVALELKGMIKAFKWSESVSEKGDGARWHFGVMAQEVEAVFNKHGLDAHEYGLFCFDQWDEKQAVLKPVLDENEKETGEFYTHSPYEPAGSRYGIRYDQLLAFIISSV